MQNILLDTLEKIGAYKPLQMAVRGGIPITQVAKDYIYNPDTKRLFPQSPVYDIPKLNDPQFAQKSLDVAMPLLIGGVKPMGQRDMADILNNITKYDDMGRVNNINDLLSGKVQKTESFLKQMYKDYVGNPGKKPLKELMDVLFNEVLMEQGIL